MRIESGPTLERRIRTLLMTLMVAAFAGWFAYDGWIGYPKENLKEHLSGLPVEERPKAQQGPVYAKVTPDTLAEAQKAIHAIGTTEQKAALAKLYGGPPTYENADAWFYFGPTHRLIIPLRAGSPVAAEIRQAARKPTDLIGQKALAGGLGVLSLYLFWGLLRVHRTHALLDDSGLSFNRGETIRWEEMSGLDSARFNEKGFVDLVYQRNGAERRQRLDEYHLASFDEIIDAICARKGFVNPLPVTEATEQPGGAT